MFKHASLCGLIVWILAMAPVAYAGKVELTTYYPAPTGEYEDIGTYTLKIGNGNISTPQDGVANFKPQVSKADDSGSEGDLYYDASAQNFKYKNNSNSGWQNIGRKVLTWSAVRTWPGNLQLTRVDTPTDIGDVIKTVVTPCNGRLVVTMIATTYLNPAGFGSIWMGPTIDGNSPAVFWQRVAKIDPDAMADWASAVCTTDRFVTAGAHTINIKYRLDTDAFYTANANAGMNSCSLQIQFFPSETEDA